jgi:hypothetical protein
MNPEILEIPVEQIVLEFPKDDYPDLLIAYLPPTPQSSSGGGLTNWDEILGKPTTFTPAPHTHVMADISDQNDDTIDGGNF